LIFAVGERKPPIKVIKSKKKGEDRFRGEGGDRR